MAQSKKAKNFDNWLFQLMSTGDQVLNMLEGMCQQMLLVTIFGKIGVNKHHLVQRNQVALRFTTRKLDIYQGTKYLMIPFVGNGCA